MLPCPGRNVLVINELGGRVVIGEREEEVEGGGAAFIIIAPPEEAADIISPPDTVIADPGTRVRLPKIMLELLSRVRVCVP